MPAGNGAESVCGFPQPGVARLQAGVMVFGVVSGLRVMSCARCRVRAATNVYGMCRGMLKTASEAVRADLYRESIGCHGF